MKRLVFIQVLFLLALHGAAPGKDVRKISVEGLVVFR